MNGRVKCFLPEFTDRSAAPDQQNRHPHHHSNHCEQQQQHQQHPSQDQAQDQDRLPARPRTSPLQEEKGITRQAGSARLQAPVHVEEERQREEPCEGGERGVPDPQAVRALRQGQAEDEQAGHPHVRHRLHPDAQGGDTGTRREDGHLPVCCGVHIFSLFSFSFFVSVFFCGGRG